MIAERVLDIAVKGLELWEKGRGLDELLDDLFREKDVDLRSKVSSILFTYFRNKGYIDYVIDSLIKRKMETVVKRIISVAMVQILFQDRIAKEVAVDVAVDFAGKIWNKRTSGFINAVLRNAIRNVDKFDQNSIKYNISNSLLKRWGKSFSPEALEGILDAVMKQPPLTFRLIGEADESVLEECSCSMLKGLSWCEKFAFYKTDRPELILKSELLESGKIYIQDTATALAPSLIEEKRAGRILDACAAPGGKAIMLSELFPDAEIVAMDRSPKRLERVIENIKRTKRKNIKAVVGDALSPPFEINSFDIVFVDVPCSNTGVIRHRPDVMWRFTQARLNEILKLQSGILNSVSKQVRPGGKLVYSVCSIEDDENRKQVDKFLKNNNEFELEKEQLLLPSKDNDGAYAAVLSRRSRTSRTGHTSRSSRTRRTKEGV